MSKERSLRIHMYIPSTKVKKEGCDPLKRCRGLMKTEFKEFLGLLKESNALPIASRS